MSRGSAKDIALAYFAQRFNCAESSLLGVAEACGLQCDCIPRIATGFGAGIGGCGDACGALSGSIMALGLKFGRERGEDQEAKAALYAKVKMLVEAFEKEFGSARCLDLTGCDMRTPEGTQTARDRKLHEQLCPRFVAFAAEMASEIIG